MPGNLATAVVSPTATVLPQSLFLSFTRTGWYPMLSAPPYNDGTFERSLITDGTNPPRSTRTWVLSRRLTTTQLSTLLSFWETAVFGGLLPFYFYDPFDVLSGHAIGSNYDATGVGTQGRVTVFFRGSWSQECGIGRNVVPHLMLVEVA